MLRIVVEHAAYRRACRYAPSVFSMATTKATITTCFAVAPVELAIAEVLIDFCFVKIWLVLYFFLYFQFER